MPFRFHRFAAAAVVFAVLALSSQSFAQSEKADADMRIQRLESQLRVLTGQNEELQYRNRQLEERLRQLGAAPGGASGAQPAMVQPGAVQPGLAQPGIAAAPPVTAAAPATRQAPGQPAYDPQIAAPAPIMQEAAPSATVQGRRRGDAFDPRQNPDAPGAPKALGGGQLPIRDGEPIGAPGGRAAGEPLDLSNPIAAGKSELAPPPTQGPGANGGAGTLPPSATAKDEFDLGIGYMQRRDYALAEETMRNFAQKHPADPLVADSQYWLGESYFQRQQYRDAAEAFLGVTTKFDKSAKAPDALLRLGQSLAALKEKEAACAALGEVLRKYPRASGSVKAAVDREQKRVKC
jgi:tol-pal system protein YbgF